MPNGRGRAAKRMPLSPSVRVLARYAMPQTICPSASVIIRKPMPEARSASRPNSAPHSGREHDRENRREQLAEAGIEQQHGRIAGQPDERRVAERDHAAIAEQQVEADGEQRIDQDLAREVEIELVADDERDRDQRGRDDDQDDGATLHDGTRPNRPCGMNTSTSTIGRNRMK